MLQGRGRCKKERSDELRVLSYLYWKVLEGRRNRRERAQTHSETSELAHDALEGCLVLAKEDGELLVLVSERTVLEDQLGGIFFEGRGELLCESERGGGEGKGRRR